MLVNALLIVSWVFFEATWSRLVAFAATWQSLYLLNNFSWARKMISERTHASISLRRVRGYPSESAGELTYLTLPLAGRCLGWTILEQRT